MESLISFPTYQDEMSCYPIVEDQTFRGPITWHAATGVIPAWLAEDYNDQSSFVGDLNASHDSDVLPGGHWDHCLKGAMYVSYMDSIQLQKLLDDDGVGEDVVLDDAHVLDNSRFQVNDTICAVQFIPVWLKDIVWTYTTDYDCAYSLVLSSEQGYMVSLDNCVYASLYTFVLEGNHQFS